MSNVQTTNNSGGLAVREVPVAFKRTNERTTLRTHARTWPEFERDLSGIGYRPENQTVIIRDTTNRGEGAANIPPYEIANAPSSAVPETFQALIVDTESEFGS